MSIIYGADKAKTWKLINEICHRKRKSGCNIKRLINSEGVTLDDPTDIANCLNDHFGTVGEKMAMKIDDVNHDNLKDPIDLIKKERNTKSMVLFPTDETELENIISKMDNKKSCGYDLLSNQILKFTK